MRTSKRITLLILLALAATSSTLVAMQYGGDRWRGGRGGRGGYDPSDRRGVPTWEVADGFKRDTFTFARVQYDSYGSAGRGFGGRRGGRGAGWDTDMPDSDLNFSLRLHQLTSLKVNPDPVVVRLDSPELFKYPFVYMIEPGGMGLGVAEVEGLRRYCLNGGFMMVDDFWGLYQWQNFEQQLKRVFPDRSFKDVPLEHPIFHMVYDMEQIPQVPAYGRGDSWRWQSYESGHGGGEETPHYRAIFDDENRIMVFACHNTDLGDAWEEEARNPEYFEMYSVKQAYPMGINIVTYAMTH